MELYIIFLIIILLLVFCQKSENMCNCHRSRLDYYGYRKCMDWDETMRRRRNNFIV
jgi:hypothetical protein